jgi:hypothetical protein
VESGLEAENDDRGADTLHGVVFHFLKSNSPGSVTGRDAPDTVQAASSG